MRYIVAATICILAVLALAQSRSGPSFVSGNSGRYQLFLSPLARADAYLVDTTTGRVWHPVTITNLSGNGTTASPEVWLPENRFDSDLAFDQWAAQQPTKKTEQQ